MSLSRDDPASRSISKTMMKGFSLSKPKSTSKPGAKPTSNSTLGKRPRSTFASHHSDRESDSNDDKSGEHEAVIAFGAGGAVKESENRPKGPLVIPKLSNRDWRGEARARMGKNLLPAEVLAAQAAARLLQEEKGGKLEGVDVVNSKDGETKWGLSVRKKEEKVDKLHAEKETHVENNVRSDKGSEPEKVKLKSADEEALEALLGKRTDKKGPDLVIPPAPGDGISGPLSEADVYRRAIALAPEASTLEDYERVPIEEFGAALLRGMGWKGPCADGKTAVKEVKRRQNLLGLGAKELKDAEELGAWVQKSDVKRLNGGADRRPERRPKASDYRMEKERREERREERMGGTYRRERERERDRERNRTRDRR